MDQPAEEEGFYSSTSGTYFPDKQALAEHYASDLHRYNLKRKVAGLPPVTKDWFDARKEQLTLSSGGSEVQKVLLAYRMTWWECQPAFALRDAATGHGLGRGRAPAACSRAAVMATELYATCRCTTTR